MAFMLEQVEAKNEQEFDVIFLDAKNDRQKIFIEPDSDQELFNRAKELSHKCKSCDKTFNRLKSLQSHSLHSHNYNLEQITIGIEPTSDEDENLHDRRNLPLEISLKCGIFINNFNSNPYYTIIAVSSRL